MNSSPQNRTVVLAHMLTAPDVVVDVILDAVRTTLSPMAVFAS